eukprot:TRINITY_DN34791_c0_g1_i1.p1 TRINITY_DN34791_c0_g1~~TRINITY_DN34791_c0_g1_i1.p1  ORF type:complete len:144 (+),score=11.10 TRINITY_DN34791_c0_g1_i1:488-919(+)
MFVTQLVLTHTLSFVRHCILMLIAMNTMFHSMSQKTSICNITLLLQCNICYLFLSVRLFSIYELLSVHVHGWCVFQAQYILDRGLGGAMFWTLDFDDFGSNVCGQGAYPLIGQIEEVLAAAGPPSPTSTGTFPCKRRLTILSV